MLSRVLPKPMDLNGDDTYVCQNGPDNCAGAAGGAAVEAAGLFCDICKVGL